MANTSLMRTKHKIGTVRKCLYFNECFKEELDTGKEWKEHWYNYKDTSLCSLHYSKLINNKREYRTKEYRKKYNDRLLNFLGKRIMLSFKIRTGFCSLCYNNIFDKSCFTTHTHHWFYLPIMPWACSEERCPACHGVETVKNTNKKRWGFIG